MSTTCRSRSGNSRPEVTIEIPENGQVAAFGDTIPYEITVTDAEDGSTTDGTIDCADVTLNISLGHDEHAHELDEQTGCEGTFETLSASGHGEEANVFPVIEAVYTDEGSGAARAPDRPRRGDPATQAQAGRVLHHDRPCAGQRRPAVTPASRRRRPRTRRAAASTSASSRTATTSPTSRSTSRASAGSRSGWPRAASAGRSSCGSTRPTGRSSPRRPRSPRPAAGRSGPTSSWRLPNPPEGTHELFVVFRGGAGGLMNVNFIDFVGKGAAISESPEVAVAADPVTGTAPLTVTFDGQTSDPDGQPGDTLTYLWDFGVPGTTTDTSTELDPTYTYERRRQLHGDPHGHRPDRSEGHGLDRDRGDRAMSVRRVPCAPTSSTATRSTRTAGPSCAATTPSRSRTAS